MVLRLSGVFVMNDRKNLLFIRLARYVIEATFKPRIVVITVEEVELLVGLQDFLLLDGKERGFRDRDVHLDRIRIRPAQLGD